MKKLIYLIASSYLLIALGSCSQEPQIDPAGPMFEKRSASQTGIKFNNAIVESLELNHFIWESLYNGGGVSIGDINNDNRPDIFFGGNAESDRLYLNKGNLKFEDITEKAGFLSSQGWSFGSTFVDINADGYLDLYVCRSGPYMEADKRNNLLYINNGDKTFTEKAKEYGVDNTGFSVQATFFDYDKDGDLDLYLVNQPPDARFKARYKIEPDPTDPNYSDRLYRNDGSSFTDVTAEAGLENYAHGLNAVATDINSDGLVDIYVSNDYEQPDLLYINLGNGRFENKSQDAFKHISFYSMGSDVADYNNDGELDIVAVDMVAEGHYRSKTNMGSMSVEKFWEYVDRGLHYQYMFNTLQLNNGNGSFSEVAQFAGVSKTDWSWAPLFADLDNDGFKDLIITNGIKKDIRNNDILLFIQNQIKQGNKDLNPLELLKHYPSVPLPNYMYRNEGNLMFSDYTENWNFAEPTFSNGLAYADLDNDGDLDLVINNIDEPASVYENIKGRLNNHLRVKLSGDEKNKFAVLSRVQIDYEGGSQVQELSLTRGYLSSVEPVLHFGLGQVAQVDKITVTWPDGTKSVVENPEINKVIQISQEKAPKENVAAQSNQAPTLFAAVNSVDLQVDFQHQENEFNDFSREILLPHKQSENGPYLATGDVNADGIEDFFIGGAAGQSGQLYLGSTNGYQKAAQQPWSADSQQEDMGALFFDADTDGDLDLYVVSGGSEFAAGSAAYQDRLYVNNGQGSFSKNTAAFGKMHDSGQVVKAADIDADGDLDLFVGGRIIPGQYPAAPNSYLLLNENGRFKNITEAQAPELQKAGLVTDAVFVDYDKDNDLDLVVVGEWMPVSIFKNNDGNFKLASAEAYVDKLMGWWWSILAEDFDKDGDIDFVVGNLGKNNKFKASQEKPFVVYANDFDKTGTNDVVLAKYSGDKLLPVRGRECTSEQMPFVATKFPTFDGFAKATLNDIYTPESLSEAIKYEVTTFESIYLKNNGANQFTFSPLPDVAQLAPIRSMIATDVNNDGNLDIIGVGNMYQSEVETVRYDAGIGLCLLGDGNGNFESMSVTKSGFFAPHDSRDMALVQTPTPMVIVANNNEKIQFFKLKN